MVWPRSRRLVVISPKKTPPPIQPKPKPKTTKPKTTKPRKIETFFEIAQKNQYDREKKGGLNEKLQKLIDKGINPYENLFSNPDSITNALKRRSYRAGL